VLLDCGGGGCGGYGRGGSRGGGGVGRGSRQHHGGALGDGLLAVRAVASPRRTLCAHDVVVARRHAHAAAVLLAHHALGRLVLVHKLKHVHTVSTTLSLHVIFPRHDNHLAILRHWNVVIARNPFKLQNHLTL
jgi:hypothetical protein